MSGLQRADEGCLNQCGVGFILQPPPIMFWFHNHRRSMMQTHPYGAGMRIPPNDCHLEIKRIRDVVFDLWDCRIGREQIYSIGISAHVFEIRVIPQAPSGLFCRQYEWNKPLPSDELHISKRICILLWKAKVFLIKGIAFGIHQIMDLLRHVVGCGIIAGFRKPCVYQCHHGDNSDGFLGASNWMFRPYGQPQFPSVHSAR
jgi:hypothetical protein